MNDLSLIDWIFTGIAAAWVLVIVLMYLANGGRHGDE